MTRHLGFLIILPVIGLMPALAFTINGADMSAAAGSTRADHCQTEIRIPFQYTTACDAIATTARAASSDAQHRATRHGFADFASEIEAVDADFVVSAGSENGASSNGSIWDFGSPALSLLALTFISIAAFARRSMDTPLTGDES